MIPKRPKKKGSASKSGSWRSPAYPPNGREGRARIRAAHQDPGRAAVPHRDKGKAGSALLGEIRERRSPFRQSLIYQNQDLQVFTFALFAIR